MLESRRRIAIRRVLIWLVLLVWPAAELARPHLAAAQSSKKKTHKKSKATSHGKGKTKHTPHAPVRVEEAPAPVDAPPPPPPPPEAAPVGRPTEAPLPPSSTAAPETQSPPASARPRWAPYFDVNVGTVISARQFDFTPPADRFRPGVAAGIRADLTLYPLASFYRPAGGILAGLGFGGTVDKPFWPASTDPRSPGQQFATSELRVDTGLRWKFTLYKPTPRPQLTILVGYGLHMFQTAKRSDGSGLPAVTYQSVPIGIQFRIHFVEWASIFAAFRYQPVLSAGAITTNGENGAGSTWGMRVEGGLDFFVYRGLKLGVTGYYERYSLTFNQMNMQAMNTAAASALDQYFGATASIGYAY
jgi:hypothetical protein